MEKIFREFVNTKIGRLEITADERAVNGVSWCGEDEESMLPEGQNPNEITQLAAAELQEYFAGVRREFTTPLRLCGTQFQKRVWEELMKIPYGKTDTYGGLARRIGRPGAARAVGMALNRNPVMIIVPCHRIVGSDGSLTGFACGVAVKAALLEMENNK